MKAKSYMTISEFAEISGIKRANLIFYDKVGLLEPERRGDNEYRYYTRRQLGTAYLIVSLRELGIGLDEIKRYADGRTPEGMMELFRLQEQRIQEEMVKLGHMSEIMKLHMEAAEAGILNELLEIQVLERPRIPIFLGQPVAEGMTEDEGIGVFYYYAADQKMEFGYPMGTVISQEMLQREAIIASRYYLRVKQRQNAYKPAGTYAVAYGRGSYDELETLYRRLLQYIRKEGLEICGDAYEETPLNEISIKNDHEYLTRVEIMVKRSD